jgi:hypothetical protein
MVYTAAQLTAFFEEAGQMGIPHETRVQLATEGIVTVDDLSEFDEDNLKQIADNLRRPSGRVPIDPVNDPQGPTMSTPAFVFGAKSFNRLKAASDLVRYYETVGRDLTAANTRWDPIIKLSQDRKVTSRTYVNSNGTSGFTTEKEAHPSPCPARFWVAP